MRQTSNKNLPGSTEQANNTEVTLKILSRVERKVSNEENHLTTKREKKLKALGVQQSRNPLSETA